MKQIISSRRSETCRLALITLLLTAASCSSYTTTLQKSVDRAEETAALGALRTVALAQQGHAISNGGNYATFQQLVDGGYLDEQFNAEAPEMHGYVLTMTVGDQAFSCNADPAQSADQKGRHFYLDSSSTLIRVNDDQPATASDKVLKF